MSKRFETNICPCCEASSLLETTESYMLYDILQAWERHGIAFSPEIYRDYPDNLLLTSHKCPLCGFGIFLPMITGSATFYADITRFDYYLPDRWDFHVALDALCRSPLRSLLDIGCGQGAFLRLAHKRLPGVRLAGNDANAQVGEAFPACATLFPTLAEIPSAAYDAVTLFQVVEHVADPVAMLREAVRILQPGGLLVVSVPDHSGPVRYYTHSHTAVPPHHVTQWTPQSLEPLIKRNNLNVQKRLTEPLPDYLFSAYLPVICAHAFRCADSPKWSDRVRRYIVDPLLKVCAALRIRSLPLHGHTFLIVARKSQ